MRRTRFRSYECLLHTACASSSPPEATLVVAAGGDGTLVAGRRACVSRECRLVPMPFGTENSTRPTFRLYKSDADRSITRPSRQGESYWLDAGRANGKLFLVMASCGFDAEVVRARSSETRRGHISRRLSYARPIVRATPPLSVSHRIRVETRDTVTSQQGDGIQPSNCLLGDGFQLTQVRRRTCRSSPMRSATTVNLTWFMFNVEAHCSAGCAMWRESRSVRHRRFSRRGPP